jgi:WD40 repeat protein
MNWHAVVLCRSILLLLCALTVRAPGADLPSESVLPEAPPEATVTLPSESELPAEAATAVAPVNTARQWPAESQLPPQQPGAGDSGQRDDPDSDPSVDPAGEDPAVQEPQETQVPDEDPLPWETAPDAVPWLRLHMQGHVAPILALAFTGDSQRLVSAGEDKAARVWTRPPAEPLRSQAWYYQRTIPWQVQRGPSGRIQAVAASGDLLAVAGYGAMGGRGEILLLDPATGILRTPLYDEQRGHRQVIVSLSLSPDPAHPGVLSVDRDGKVIYWSPGVDQGGQWQPKLIRATDVATHGQEAAERLRDFRGMAPGVLVDAHRAILPEYVPSQSGARVAWRLMEVDVRSGARRWLPGQTNTIHQSMVTALTRSPDGGQVASADAHGALYVWDVARGRLAAQKTLPSPGVSLAFGRGGHTLAVGLAALGQQRAMCQIWDLRNPQSGAARRFGARHDVRACALSADGHFLAYSDGNDIILWQLSGEHPGRRLRVPVEPPLRVAFAKEAPLYRIAYGTRSDQRGNVPLQNVFQTSPPQLSLQREIEPDQWLSEDSYAFDWRIRSQQDGSSTRYWLYQGQQRRGEIRLDVNLDGVLASQCWIPDAAGRQAVAVAVGTRGGNNIYVFRLVAEGVCPIIRVLRGHESGVTTMCLSADRRYLVSGSHDATIRIWPMPRLPGTVETVERWGAQFEAQGDQLLVSSVDPAGPLHFRGMRAGDQITRLKWSLGLDAGGQLQQREATDPQDMLQILQSARPHTLVAFEYLRGRAPGRPFQIYPAWQQLVSLAVAENREWAFWVPAGYYDASFEGHKLFGWQINRGLYSLPDFFLAAQLRQSLERPDVLSRLLEAGSVDQAFRLANRDVPASPHRAITDAIRLNPHVEILSPSDSGLLNGDTAELVARIVVPAGQQLVAPRAFANGVVAVKRELLGSKPLQAGATEYRYRWILRLPSDKRILFQVVAATDTEGVDAQSLLVTRSELPQRFRSRLFVASAGVNHYRDAQVPQLEFAVNNATQLAYTLHAAAASLYRTHAVSLLDDQVTRAMWTTTMTQFAETLRRQVSPDDVLVIFLSGHGLRDRQTERYYYLTSESRYRDVMAGQYADCMSFEDFSVFADVPCRKLVILDTCHSGAIQPLQQRQLKAALRALQDDLVFTLTASEGSQEAIESRERRLGRFTYRLLEGLGGVADRQGGNSDGVVSWPELVSYVQTSVLSDSAGDANQQFPTAGPSELLEVVQLPLAQSATAMVSSP